MEKSFIKLFAALFAAFTITSCNKENSIIETSESDGVNVQFELKMNSGVQSSRAAAVDVLNPDAQKFTIVAYKK